MFAFIRKLQGESEGARRRYALGGALVVTAIIFIVWLSTFSFKTSTDEEIGRPDIGPLDSLIRGFGQLFD